MINFDVEPEFQEQIDWVEKFAKEEIEPLDNFFRVSKTKDGQPLTEQGWSAIRKHIERLKEQVKAQGLWGFHLGPELGGPGLGQVKLCLLNEKLGRTRMGPRCLVVRLQIPAIWSLLRTTVQRIRKKTTCNRCWQVRSALLIR